MVIEFLSNHRKLGKEREIGTEILRITLIM